MAIVAYWLSFEGRLRRSDFWGRVIAVSVAVCIWLPVMFIARDAMTSDGFMYFVLAVGFPFYALMAVMNVSTHVRRWHDRDKSGWWILIGLIPMVGPIWSFVECGFLDGTPGPNRFGPSPKADELAGRAGAPA